VKLRLVPLLAACVLLCGCSSILNREYSTVEAHSSHFWESEAAGTLRAESYQDVVNDLLLLIGQHTETAVIRLYNYNDLTVSDLLEKAASEVQQETPLGNYAVEYITSSSTAQRGYYELSVQIGYRRTENQIQAVVNATSTAGLSALLESALNDGKQELAVRIGYWSDSDYTEVTQTVADVRAAAGLTDTPEWTISYYPAQGPVGLIEFNLNPSAQGDSSAAGDASASSSGQTSGAASGQADGTGSAQELPAENGQP